MAEFCFKTTVLKNNAHSSISGQLYVSYSIAIVNKRPRGLDDLLELKT